MTNRRITLTAARVPQHAWLSSRWVLSGVASPACSDIPTPGLPFGLPFSGYDSSGVEIDRVVRSGRVAPGWRPERRLYHARIGIPGSPEAGP
jgi:hypothetical protein